MKITVTNHVTLDGVMQAPAGPDEDRRGGFQYGGWAAGDNDAVMGEEMARGMARRGALLLGRRTYEHFFSFWPKQKDNNPFTAVLNDTQKYVASNTLKDPLPWQNSTLLSGDAAEAVARMKAQGGPDLAVLGSGELIESLMRRNLIDEFLVMIHPVVLGTGKRLFREGGPYAALRLVDSKVTTKGVVMATYRPGEKR
jgi:dihydrofolate reductase